MTKLLPQNFAKKLSGRARSTLNRVFTFGRGTVRPVDLLYALTLERGALSRNVLESYNVSLEAVRRLWLKKDTAGRAREEYSLEFSNELKRVLTRSVAVAAEHKNTHIGTEHLLYAVLEEGILSSVVEKKPDQVVGELKRQIATLLKSSARFPHLALIGEFLKEESSPRSKSESRRKTKTSGIRPKHHLTEPKRSTVKEDLAGALEYFGEDLSAKAVRSELDPLIGREEEVERALSILSRRSKNNPILIGEAGVGKTAIVHGLAQRLANRAVPEHLAGRRLVALDLGLLVAGTVFRGEFESRLKDVIQEAVQEKAIIFIDEIHTIVGAGSAQGALDAANMLKPAISTGELQVIGATTTDEYRRSIEKDPALERRFQPIVVEEPSLEETITILRGLRSRLENYHRIRLSDEVIEKAAHLAGRFLNERKLPDKAIDVLDEAAARLRSKQTLSPQNEQIFKLKESHGLARQEKELAVRAGQYDRALHHKIEEDKLQNELAAIKRRVGNELSSSPSPVLTIADIEAVISQMAGVSLERISEPEKHRFKKLEGLIKEYIVGQDEAVRALVTALSRARSGIKEDRRPIGSFLFWGPSGVGKTELARVLARVWLEDPNRLIKLDMSEFSESHTVAKFLGSPPGYVGYDEPNTILELVRRRTSAVVLFDEIEKAHPRVQNLLLQILEDGGLTDAKGTRVNFEHSLIILTANIGQNQFSNKRGLGFRAAKGEKQAGLGELSRHLKPELISRLDKVIIFKPLGKSEIKKIVERELNQLKGRIRERGWNLVFLSSALGYLAERSQSSRYGARKVRATVRQLVEDDLAQKIITGELAGIRRISLAATKKSLKWRLLKR